MVSKCPLWVTHQAQNDEAITGYYSICSSGARTLSTCEKIASVLWLLGLARRQPHIKRPSNSSLNHVADYGYRYHQEEQ